MISVFVKEQKRYTQFELAKLLECSPVEIKKYIQLLKQYGIVKAVKGSKSQKNMSDLLEQDIEIESPYDSEQEYYYVFTFVGVISAFGRVIKCYPKYIFNDNAPASQLKTVLQVLQKYNANQQIVQMFSNSNEEKSFNLLSVILYLLKDYYENGIYTNEINVIETNGSGEILWDKTINDSFVYLNNNRPYYVDIYTKKRIRNNSDYFRKLHEIIISICSRELIDAQLTELFDLEPVELTEDPLSCLGDTNDILYHIQIELNNQFNTRKQLVLKMLYTYISQASHLNDMDAFSMFGTNSFNLVWEKVCARVMNNQLDKPLINIPIKSDKFAQYTKLKSIVEHPKWSGIDDGGKFEKLAKDTLIPDIISVVKENNGYTFIIFDAKYYNIKIDRNELSGYPGIGDVTKQYLYQLAYKDLIDDSGIKSIKNCFLMPTENSDIIKLGQVRMEMLENIGLKNIQIRLLPANDVYEYYLNDKKYDISRLEL